MLTRRQFIDAMLGGLVVVSGWRYWHSNQEEAVVMVLRKRLAYLKLDPQGMRAFAADLVAQHLLSPMRLKLIGAVAPLYRRISLDGHDALQELIRHGEERVVSNYLLSSDFFVNGADIGRTVHYLGFYDPLKGCSSPFARFAARADDRH
ncbi:MAG: hypothetical protein KGL25_11895 [Gammaproteobacteria bacterium]|nr:hypothetical protein [Gammaproteobacteria bacterium]